jgi:hypothetical protein
VKEGTPLAQLLGIACGAPAPNIRGTYEGMNDATYKKGGQGEQKISITVEQNATERCITKALQKGY